MARILLVAILLTTCAPTWTTAGDSGRADWARLARMPTPRSEIASAVVGDRIYVVGGVSHRGSLRAFECYDTATGRWTRLASLPVRLNHCGIASRGPRVFVSGGFFDLFQRRWSSRLFVYDTRTGEWQERSSLPGPRVKHFMIERGGWLHLIGGLRHREVWSYHIDGDRWRMNLLPALPQRRDHITVLQDEACLYVVGGRRDSVVETACWRLVLDGGGWSTFTHLPLPRAGQAAALFGGRIHVVGGEDFNGHRTWTRHDVFDLATGEWRAASPLPVAKHGMASSVHRGRWFVFGGGRRSRIGTVFSASRSVHALPLGMDTPRR